MNILFINAHWNNRGDEAAIRAMLDEIRRIVPDAELTIQILAKDKVYQFPYGVDEVKLISKFPQKDNLLELPLLFLTNFKMYYMANTKEYMNALKKADIVVHAPGGPSIGEIYKKFELSYWIRLLAVIAYKKPLFFYAPSMGPFTNSIRNIIRRWILNKAIFICTREEISKEYASILALNKEIIVTLDSAVQNNIDIVFNEEKLQEYTELDRFLADSERVIGITITDLQWNPKYKENILLKENIENTFVDFLRYLVLYGYKVIFIPQLFGDQNDYNYMKRIKEKVDSDNIFVMSDNYDCYFQQFVISKIKAVVGMRYHSNIFSAKMKTPFVSVSYEHKMAGFMKNACLDQYCIDVNDLNFDKLLTAFNLLEKNYVAYKFHLDGVSQLIKSKAAKSTEYLLNTYSDSIEMVSRVR